MRQPFAPDVDETARSRVVVVLIALFRLVKGLVFAALGVLEVRVLGSEHAEERLVALAERVRAFADRIGIEPSQARVDHLVQRLLAIGDGRLRIVETTTFLVAALFLVEAVGLLLDRRWAEWLVVVSTTLLIPFEIWNVVGEGRWDHAWIVALNAAVAAYLFVHVRGRMRARRAAERAAAAA
jgi:uncharacterized membrane protein (DUF2068 family)